MILEAFASYLKAADDKMPATQVLAQWLWERLSQAPSTQVDRVLHEEIAVKRRGAASKGMLIYGPNAAAYHSQSPGSSRTGSPIARPVTSFRLCQAPDRSF